MRITRTQQPQTPVGIDWGNPLSSGLVFAWVPANDKLTKSGAVGRVVNKYGTAISTNGSSTYEYMHSAPVFDLNECSLTAILTPTAVGNASQYAVSAGQNASANPLFIIGQADTSGNIGFTTKDISGTAVNAQGSSSDWANGKTSVVTGTRSKTAAVQRLFANGKQVASTAAGTAAATTFDRFAIGCLLRSTAALHWNGAINLVLIHNRALSYAEIRSLSYNPWQIFAPIDRPIFVGLSAPTGDATVIPIGQQATGSVGTPTATGASTTTASGVSAAWAIGTPTAVGGSSIPATALPAGVSASASVGTPTATGAAFALPAGIQSIGYIGQPVALAGGSAVATPLGVNAISAVGTLVAMGACVTYPLGLAGYWSVGTPLAVVPGDAVWPIAADVRIGVMYGPTGVEYTGTATGNTGPTAADIAAAVWAYSQ